MINKVKRKFVLGTVIVGAVMALAACDLNGLTSLPDSTSGNTSTSEQITSSFESSSISNTEKTTSGGPLGGVNSSSSSSSSSTSSAPRVVLTNITAVNNKESYEIGDELDITVTAHYSNGDTAIVSEYEVSGFNNRTPGEQVVTITYGDVSTTVTVVVNPAHLVSISVVNNKESYDLGEELDLTVTATYSDETTKTVTEYDVTGYDNQTPGTQTVTVTYEDKSASIEVIVNEPYIVDLRVVDNKAETGYELGDELDLTVTAYYSNNVNFTVDEYEVTGFDNQTPGTQTLTVTYDGMAKTLDVVVNEPVDQFPIEALTSFLEEEKITTSVPTPIGYNEWSSSVEYNQDFSKYFFARTNDEVAEGEATISETYKALLETEGWTVNEGGLSFIASKAGADVKVEFANNDKEFAFRAYAFEEVPTRKTMAAPITNTNQFVDGGIIVFGNTEFGVVATGLDNGAFDVQECQYNNGNIVTVASNVVRFKMNKTSSNRWTLSDARGRKLGSKGLGKLVWDDGSTEWIISVSNDTTLIMNNKTSFGSIYYNPNTAEITTFSASERKNMKQLQLFSVETVDIIYPTAISISGDAEISQGRSGKLSVTFEPENTNEKAIVWSSSDEGIATVNANGVVTGVAVGSVTITAKAFNRTDEILATFDVTITEQVGDAWTIFLYICGTNLESNSGLASGDISEILSVRNQPDDVNIVIETGGARSWSNYGISANKIGRYHVENKQLVKDASLANANMGKSSTLQSFLEWGLQEYPADKTGLIFWNHGGGLDGCCFDDNYSGDGLTSTETTLAVDNALANLNINSKLEWVGYDCCLMQVQDIAEFNSKNFNYMVGSEETEAGDGWAYDEWVDNLYAGDDTETILAEIADTFVASNDGNSGWGWGGSSNNDQTLSVLDLNKMDAYFTKFEAMASAIKSTVNSNKNTFRSVINSCKKYEAFDSYGLVDGKDFLNKLAANSKFSSHGEIINEVKNLYSEMVIHNVKGGAAGNSNGLAFHTPISYYDYPTNETHFTNWASIFANL